MKHYIAFIIATLMLVACHSEEKDAQQLGEYHAKQLLTKPLSDKELQYRLLEIRAIETEIRSNGYNDAADAYIKAFTDCIKVNNDSLAQEIF